MRTILKGLYLNLRALLLYGAGLLLRNAPAAGAHLSPAKILFIRIDRLGDMVLSTPALLAIKEKFPSAKICVLASPGPAGLLEGAPYVDKVYLWEPRRGPAALLRTIGELKAAGFDLAVDPYYGYELRTALLAFLSGAAARAGYAVYGRGIFFNLRAEAAWSGVHFADEAFGVLKLLGITGERPAPQLFVTPRAEAEAGAILEKAGACKAGQLVAVHPGGHYPSQRWPAARFAEVINAIAAGSGTRMLLIGSSAEGGVTEGVLSLLSPAVKAGVICAIDVKTGTLSALLRRSSLFIGNNSGPLHMAAALGVPSVSTMGPTDPAKWSPIGPRHTVLRTGLPCGGCGRGDCAGGCMLDITAQQVVAAAKNMLL